MWAVGRRGQRGAAAAKARATCAPRANVSRRAARSLSLHTLPPKHQHRHGCAPPALTGHRARGATRAGRENAAARGDKGQTRPALAPQAAVDALGGAALQLPHLPPTTRVSSATHPAEGSSSAGGKGRSAVSAGAFAYRPDVGFTPAAWACGKGGRQPKQRPPPGTRRRPTPACLPCWPSTRTASTHANRLRAPCARVLGVAHQAQQAGHLWQGVVVKGRPQRQGAGGGLHLQQGGEGVAARSDVGRAPGGGARAWGGGAPVLPACLPLTYTTHWQCC